ncbi:MAG: hypothetical protein AAF564_21250 [Bacteroidota bacterium]
MKTIRVLIFALLLFATQRAHAQWSWKASLEAGLSQVDNIFKSPGSLLLDGQMLDADLLYANDLSVPLSLKMDATLRTGTHRIDLDYRSVLNRYSKLNYLNGGYHYLRLGDSWQVAKAWRLSARVTGRVSRRVGTNILGDELARVYAYASLRAEAGLRWAPSRRHTFEAGYQWNRYNYDETAGLQSLDQSNLINDLGWTYRSRKRKGKYRKVSMDLTHRIKTYHAYLSRSASGLQNPGSPLNQLTYYDAALGFEWGLTRWLAWDIDLEGRVRNDAFEDYYSYIAAGINSGFDIEPIRNVLIRAEAGWRSVNFKVREALLPGGSDAPRLVYNYINWHFEASCKITRSITVTAFAESNDRVSNATLESSRIRRSYQTFQNGLTLTYTLGSR